MSKKILIVDDDTGFVSKIMDSISGKNFCFSIADSLNRAKYLLKRNKFDLILANVKVPGGNSLQLKEKNNFSPSNTNFLFMSNIDSDYNYVKSRGEECCYKYDFNNSIKALLENA